MRKTVFVSLLAVVLTLLISGHRAYAQESILLTPVASVEQLETAFEFQLSTRSETYGRPKATSYYDDLEDHYEQDQLMVDVIAAGL